MSTTNAGWIGVLLFTLAASAQANIEAGRVQFTIGDARALAVSGTERALKKGDAVHEGETIITGASASMQLRMADKAVIAVRPNSRLQIDAYRFQGREGGSEHAVLHLLKGGFRTITGLIGRTNKDNYKIITDTANIGIRGTDHEPAYLPPTGAGEASDDAPGTYDKVNTGLTYIATPAGRVNLSPGQVGFASSQPGAAPVQLDGVPGFMRSTPPIRESRARSGEDQPGRVAAPGSDNPETYAAESWVHGEALAYGHDPRIVTLQQASHGTLEGTLDFTGTASAATSATGGSAAGGTDRMAVVYGDLTGGVALNGAFTAERTPAEKFFDGTANALVATDPTSKLRYTRGLAPTVDSRSDSFDVSGTTVIVNWGIYEAGILIDAKGLPGLPDYMQLMGAPETPAAVVSGLTATYSTVAVSTPIIAESGIRVGGQVDTAFISLDMGNLKRYEIGVTDGNLRKWSAECTDCLDPKVVVSLADFKGSGVALSGLVTGPTPGATGRANGHPVGPTGQGVISSFALQDGAAAITGSFVVSKDVK